jgi:hypothetical protein
MISATAAPADVEQLVEVHRETWLRQAEATIMALDPQDYRHGRTFHVLDFTEVGAPPRGYLGFTAGDQLHELAEHLLPHSRNVPAAAVAVNVEAIAREAVTTADAHTSDRLDAIRAAVAAVAAHELAHALDARAEGRRLPEGAALDAVVRSLVDGRASNHEHQTKTHSPGWLRAFLHLTLRHGSRERAWFARVVADVAAVMPHEAETYFDALRPDFMQHRREARLVDVLRSPAPRAFLDLFDSHDTDHPATGALAHASPS